MTFYLIEDISGVQHGDDQRWFLRDTAAYSGMYEGCEEQAWTLFCEDEALRESPVILGELALFHTEAAAKDWIAQGYTTEYSDRFIRVVPMTLGSRQL